MLALLVCSTTVALELRAMPLEQALPRIGAAYAVPMRAAPAIAGEIVIARLDGVPVEEVKSRLASEFAAEWRTGSDGTLYLAPSAKVREAQRRQWLNAPRVRMGRLIDDSRRRVQRFEPFTSASAIRLRGDLGKPSSSYAELSARAPAGRLLRRLLADLRPEAFAIGDPIPRTVLVLEPNELQAPLGPNAREALRLYRDEAALWNSLEPPREGPPMEEGIPREPVRGSATRILLTAEPGEGGAYLSLQLFDDSGQLVDAETLTIEDSVEGAVPATDVPYKYEPAAGITPAMQLQGEPLAYAPSEILLSAARTAGRSVIVAPSDRLIERDPQAANTLYGYLSSGYGHPEARGVTFDAPNWMRIQTDDPAAARAAFFPRKQFRQALNALLTPEYMSTSVLIAYNAFRPAKPYGLPIESAILAAHPGRWPYYNSSDVELAAALTPAEWKAAIEGPVPIPRLNPRARALVHRAVFHSSNFGGQTGMFGCGTRPEPRWSDEVTNSASLSAMVLKLEREPRSRAQLPLDGVPTMVRPYELKALLENAKAGKNPEPEEPNADISRIRFFEQTGWQLTLEQGERWHGSLSLEDPPKPLHPGTYTATTIPDEIHRALKDSW